MLFTALISLTTALFLFLFYNFILRLYITAWKLRKMDPHLPILIRPFVGILSLFRDGITRFGDSHHFVKEMMKQSQPKAYLTNVGSQPFLILCEATLVKELSTNPKSFRKFNFFKHSHISFARGIFFAEDEDWSSQRRIISHSFNNTTLQQMVAPISKTIAKYVSCLSAEINSNSSRVYKVLTDSQILIGDILIELLFSGAAKDKKVLGRPITLVLAEFSTAMFQRSRQPINILFALFAGDRVNSLNFTAEDRQLQREINAIRMVIDEIIEERKMLNKEGKIFNDFMQNYLNEMEKNDRVDKEELLQQLVSFYFAGIDTTGHLIAFAVYAAAQFPDYCAEMRDQLQRVLAGRQVDELTYADLGVKHTNVVTGDNGTILG